MFPQGRWSKGAMISCGHCWESRGGETFWGRSCVAGEIPLSVKDGSCEGAPGKCESKPGALVSGSIQHQLLGLCSTWVSVTDCGWGESSNSDAERGPGSVHFWGRLLMATASRGLLRKLWICDREDGQLFACTVGAQKECGGNDSDPPAGAARYHFNRD